MKKYLRYAQIAASKVLTYVFNMCLEGDYILDKWKKADISSIFKKNNRKDCSDYRDISMTSSVSRLCGRILKVKIEEQVDEIEEQNDFRSGKLCSDNIFCLKQLVEEAVFIDKKDIR